MVRRRRMQPARQEERGVHHPCEFTLFFWRWGTTKHCYSHALFDFCDFPPPPPPSPLPPSLLLLLLLLTPPSQEGILFWMTPSSSSSSFFLLLLRRASLFGMTPSSSSCFPSPSYSSF